MGTDFEHFCLKLGNRLLGERSQKLINPHQKFQGVPPPPLPGFCPYEPPYYVVRYASGLVDTRRHTRSTLLNTHVLWACLSLPRSRPSVKSNKNQLRDYMTTELKIFHVIAFTGPALNFSSEHNIRRKNRKKRKKCSSF